MSPFRSLVSLRLSTLFFGFMALVLAASLVVVIGVVRHHLQDMEDDIQAYGAMRSGQSLHINFTEAMDREWSSVNAVSRTLDLDELAAITPRLKAISQIGDHILWAGVVAPWGEVVVSSVDELLGMDVSGSEFYRHGLSGSYVGSTIEDQLAQRMERIFPGEARYIDMSAPIVGSDGAAGGILVYRLGMGWLDRVLHASADALAIDAFVVDGRGEVVIRAGVTNGDDLSDAEMLVMKKARLDPTRVDMPDGSASFVSVLPQLVQGSFSDLDWRVATRVKGLPEGLVVFDRNLIAIVVGLIIGLWALGSLFARAFLLPIERIGDAVASSAADHGLAQDVGQGSHTAKQLSSAIRAFRKLGRAHPDQAE